MSVRYNFTKKFQEKVQKLLLNRGISAKSEQDLDIEKIKAPVDLYSIDSHGKEFLIEFEIHRADPSNNIIKIAYWLEKDKNERDITVIQIFSPQYTLQSRDSAKKEVAKYLGKTLIESIHGQKYVPINIEGLSRTDFNDIYKSFKSGKSETKPDPEKCESMVSLAKQVSDKIWTIMRDTL